MSDTRWWRGPEGRLRPTLRAVLYLPALLVANLTLLLPFTVVLAVTRGSDAPMQLDLVHSAVGFVVTFLSLVAVASTTWGFRHFLDGRSFASLGMRLRTAWMAELASGFALGALLMGLVFAAEVGTGQYRIEALVWREVGGGDVLVGLVISFVVFALVALNEELIARGYLLQNLAEDWGLLAAVMATSVLFALGHLANPGANLLSTAGLTVAGLLLAAGYVATRSLWLPIGLHLAWNFIQGPVLGFPVSGLPPRGLLQLSPQGAELLTGGLFGPEASLVGIGVEVIGIALLWVWCRRTRPSHPLTHDPARVP